MVIFTYKTVKNMIEYPCAKINLGLNIVNKRSDGYHNLETVFYPIRLVDELCIEEVKTKKADTSSCLLNVDGIRIDGDTRDNLVVKAYELLKSHYPSLPDISVKLTKNIPTQAGMGGGSSDCAYTITALNRMFNLKMSVTDMQALASELGADCAFFINPVPSFATGIGEKLTTVDLDLSKYTLAIVKPPLKISTKEAFSRITPKHPQKHCLDIITQPLETWKEELVNDFEQSIFHIYPETAYIKRTLYDIGAIYASMSGSGSAFYGIFDHKPNDIGNKFDKCFTCII